MGDARTNPGEANDSVRPTIVRHVVVFVSVLMSLLLYLDRFCVSFAERYIKEDLGLTNYQIGWVLSAFFWSYALAQVPSGWLTDRYGARGLMVLYIVTWSAFTALTGLASGFLFLIAMRLGFGIGQAGAYPTAAGLLSRWVPFGNRGTASSFVALGGRIGGAIAPLLTMSLMLIFVPSSKSSALQEHQLLPGQAAALGAKIFANATPAANRIWTLLSDEERTFIQTIGEKHNLAQQMRTAVLLEAESLTEQNKPSAAQQQRSEAEKLAYQLSPPERTRLIDILNSLLDRDDFYSPEAFGALNLEREGLSFLRRIQEGQSLTSHERQRLNRLLLETAFPTEIGKIYVAGWRPMMFVYGISGLLVAFLFLVAYRNRPEEHPLCNAAEHDLINAGRPAGAPSPHGKAGAIPWGRFVRSISLWLDSLTQVGTNIGWLFLVTFLARYLYEVHHVEIVTRAWMASIPLMGGMLGMLAGGPLTDRLVLRVGLKWGRRLPISITRFIAAAMYVASLWTNDPWMATILFALVAFFCDLGIAALWAFKQDVGGRYVGSILGWGNMWGNLAAACALPLYNWVLTEQPTPEHWQRMFLVCAGAFCLSGVAGMGIDATIPIAPPDDEQKTAPAP